MKIKQWLLGTLTAWVVVAGCASAQEHTDWDAVWQWLGMKRIEGQQWFDSLSPRLQALDRGIGAIYYEVQTQQNAVIPVTNETVQLMMEAVGAFPEERDFVIERMQTYVSTGSWVLDSQQYIDWLDQQMRDMGFGW